MAGYITGLCLITQDLEDALMRFMFAPKTNDGRQEREAQVERIKKIRTRLPSVILDEIAAEKEWGTFPLFLKKIQTPAQAEEVVAKHKKAVADFTREGGWVLCLENLSLGLLLEFLQQYRRSLRDPQMPDFGEASYAPEGEDDEQRKSREAFQLSEMNMSLAHIGDRLARQLLLGGDIVLSRGTVACCLRLTNCNPEQIRTLLDKAEAYKDEVHGEEKNYLFQGWQDSHPSYGPSENTPAALKAMGIKVPDELASLTSCDVITADEPHAATPQEYARMLRPTTPKTEG